MGQAMGSLFPEPAASPSLTDIKDDIDAGFTKLSDQLTATEVRLTQNLNHGWKSAHLDRLKIDAKDPLYAAIGAYNPWLAAAGGSELQSNDLAIQTIIIAGVKYSEGLSTDIKIGEGADGYNGFWRSFNPYVSNQVLTLSFNMERWSSNQKQPGYPVAGNNPIHYAKQTLLSLDSYF
jgi:hypothetical protein